MNKKDVFWLTRRLKELGKTKLELASAIEVYPARFSELEDGKWKFQISHIRKVAEFLEFDRTAFLDFISGDITEEELWESKKPINITEEDLALLKAVKSIATRPQTAEEAANPPQSPELPKKERER